MVTVLSIKINTYKPLQKGRDLLISISLSLPFYIFIFFPPVSLLRKADIRNPLCYLLMNAVASRSVSGSFQLPLTEASPSLAA